MSQTILGGDSYPRLRIRQADSGLSESWVSGHSRVQRGLKSQDIVAKYFAANGWPFALSAGSGRQGSDVTGVPGVDVEVKARRGINVAMAMKQLRERHQEGVLPVAVLRLDGQGESHIADWPAIVPLSVFLDLLKAAGYVNRQP